MKTAVEEMGNEDCSGGDGESRLQWRRWGIKTAIQQEEEKGNLDCNGGDGESRLHKERATARESRLEWTNLEEKGINTALSK